MRSGVVWVCGFQPKVVVFGGNGYVGSHVCQALLSLNSTVASVNRSGQPTSPEWDHWWHDVEWVKADVFDVGSWSETLQGARGCAGPIHPSISVHSLRFQPARFQACGTTLGYIYVGGRHGKAENQGTLATAQSVRPCAVGSSCASGVSYIQRVSLFRHLSHPL
jgi:hypothetical protein